MAYYYTMKAGCQHYWQVEMQEACKLDLPSATSKILVMKLFVQPFSFLSPKKSIVSNWQKNRLHMVYSKEMCGLGNFMYQNFINFTCLKQFVSEDDGLFSNSCTIASLTQTDMR